MIFKTIEVIDVMETSWGVEHWVKVDYKALGREFSCVLLILKNVEVRSQALIDYIVRVQRYRDLVLHSVNCMNVKQ